MASWMALQLDILNSEQYGRIKNILTRSKLPIKAKGVSSKDVLNSYKHDKKVTKGVNRFVLPLCVGEVGIVEAIPDVLIHKAVAEFSQ